MRCYYAFNDHKMKEIRLRARIICKVTGHNWFSTSSYQRCIYCGQEQRWQKTKWVDSR